LVENMHDVPYVQSDQLGPEITASMTAIAIEVKRVFNKRPIGLQILALGNCQALAAAQASGCQFIRNEGFVFAHVADEGITSSNAGQVLRYSRQIGAENILVLTDIKKKHSAHSLTDDVSLLETAHAAEFFCTDGVILTGTATGCAANKKDLIDLHGKIQAPIVIGSGVTVENLTDYFYKSDAIIVGSHFKSDGRWCGTLSPDRIDKFMEKTLALREKSKNSA
jgi:uncharacterized protein